MIIWAGGIALDADIADSPFETESILFDIPFDIVEVSGSAIACPGALADWSTSLAIFIMSPGIMAIMIHEYGFISDSITAESDSVPVPGSNVESPGTRLLGQMRSSRRSIRSFGQNRRLMFRGLAA